MRALAPALSAAALLLGGGGCGKARSVAPARQCATWSDDVAPLLAARCAGCHSGAGAAAGFLTTSYLDAVGDTSGVRLLARLDDPARADGAHALAPSEAALVRAWVVDCRVAYARSPIHPA